MSAGYYNKVRVALTWTLNDESNKLAQSNMRKLGVMLECAEDLHAPVVHANQNAVRSRKKRLKQTHLDATVDASYPRAELWV